MSLQKKLNQIERQISEKQAEVDSAFKDYTNICYHLHAILIHDGTAQSGHYYSFIFDRKEETWWRFSDVNVSKVEEEVVFQEAFGGQKNSSKVAYSIIYVNEYCIGKIMEDPKASYLMGEYLNAPLKESIVLENKSFIEAQNKYNVQ